MCQPVAVKVMEKVILSVITLHLQDNQKIRPSHHELIKCRSCLTTQPPEEKAVAAVYLTSVKLLIPFPTI